MPNGSVYARYLWYLRLLTYNGFVVVVDNHLNPDPTITKDVQLWAQVQPYAPSERRWPLIPGFAGLSQA